MPGEAARRRRATLRRSGVAKGSASRAAPAQHRRAAGFRREREEGGAIIHERFVALIGPIPFEHGEFGMVKRAALLVAEHAREGEDAGLARGDQLLAGEFRRGVEIEPPPRAVRCLDRCRHRVEMRLVAGRGLQNARLDLDEPLLLEPSRELRG